MGVAVTGIAAEGERLLLLTSQVEVFALHLESMAVRHPRIAAECAELSGRMRGAVHEHRSAVRTARQSSDGLPAGAEGIDSVVPTTKENDVASGVAAVWVPVQDMERSVAFYRDVLGLEVRSQESDWSEIEAGGLMIGLNAREETAAHSAGGAVISFQPDGSIEDEVEKLKSKGVEFTGGISDYDWGRIIPFKDPDGNDLQFYSPPKS